MAKAQKSKVDAVESAQEEAPKAGAKFKVDGKSYQFAIAKFIVPGLGVLTALEAATDDTKHEELGGLTVAEFLVSVKSAIIEEA